MSLGVGLPGPVRLHAKLGAAPWAQWLLGWARLGHKPSNCSPLVAAWMSCAAGPAATQLVRMTKPSEGVNVQQVKATSSHSLVAYRCWQLNEPPPGRFE